MMFRKKYETKKKENKNIKLKIELIMHCEFKKAKTNETCGVSGGLNLV